MAKEVVEFFQAQFTKERTPTNFDIITHVPKMISEEKNDRLWEEPTMEEVNATIFRPNGDIASGLVGFTRQFNQTTWEIISEYVLNMVRAFFCGVELPKFITHTQILYCCRRRRM